MSVMKRRWKSGDEFKTAWVVRYATAPGRGKGLRHIKTFATKAEAVAFEATTRVDIARGVHVAASKSVTVAKAGRLWLDACAGLEATTVDSYDNHVNLHIVPFLGGIKLSALTVAAVRDWQDRLRKGTPAPGATKGEKRSADMIRRATISLGAMLADAQERGLVATNVVRSLKANRRRGKERQAEQRARGKLKVGVDIPRPEEIRAILGAAEGRWRPLLLVAIFAGLRSSEIRGLRWEDVDFRKGELRVHQRADAYNVIGRPKSAAGERMIPIDKRVVQELREWKLKCPKGDLGLCFPTGAGKVESRSNINKRGLAPTMVRARVTKQKGLDAAGKPILMAKYGGLHSLRHFNASWLINRKIDGGCELPPKIVQERLGHSSISVTMDRYGHLFPRGDDSAELAAATGALFGTK